MDETASGKSSLFFFFVIEITFIGFITDAFSMCNVFQTKLIYLALSKLSTPRDRELRIVYYIIVKTALTWNKVKNSKRFQSEINYDFEICIFIVCRVRLLASLQVYVTHTNMPGASITAPLYRMCGGEWYTLISIRAQLWYRYCNIASVIAFFYAIIPRDDL